MTFLYLSTLDIVGIMNTLLCNVLAFKDDRPVAADTQLNLDKGIRPQALWKWKRTEEEQQWSDRSHR